MKPSTAHPSGGSASDRAAEKLLQQQFFALNQLSAGIVHEFNNITAGVLGSAELIAMDISEGHPAHETLQNIFAAGSRARDCLNQIQTFSQRPPVQLTAIPLPPVIEEILQTLRGGILGKVQVETRINPDCPQVNADPAQLRQALLDLCVHCWQGSHERHGHAQLTLEVGAPPKELSATLPEKIVHLAIHDHSHVLNHSALDKLFAPFHTCRVTGRKIGLELFLARETIHAHHGEIVTESEPGQGLTFHLYLPAA